MVNWKIPNKDNFLILLFQEFRMTLLWDKRQGTFLKGHDTADEHVQNLLKAETCIHKRT